MSKPTEQRPLRVGVISLGCAKNLVDAEIMLGSLLKGGVEITNDPANADAVIVNTCSFIDSAQEESVDAILESNEVREVSNRGQALIVSGCLPQRFRNELPKLLPEVDAFMGIDQVAQVDDIVQRALASREEKLRNGKSRVPSPKSKVRARVAELDREKGGHEHDAPGIGPGRRAGKTPNNGLANATTRPDAAGTFVSVNLRPTFIPDFDTPRFRLTPKHFAYVKIAEGCNHPCSFCIIPRMRGSHRSRQQSDIVREVRQLVADGVKEINLISQDSTYYGLDLRVNPSRAISSPERFNAAAQSLPADATTLCTLLRELNAIEGEFWIRLLYTHPAHWTDELIQTIADCPKVARYVDMPLQHIHENMLERMRRETSQQYIVELIRRIRAGIPRIALRTTFIVGFPGETEDYFSTLLEFIRETKFERLGIFTYSKEETTRAAKMESQIPPHVKQKRRERAMTEQHHVARTVSQSFMGRNLKVLVEGNAGARELQKANVSSWEHGLIRNTDSAAAQLKGRYLIARGEADAPDIDGRIYIRGQGPVGDFAQVRVIGHTDYDLIAEPA
ncbi:MAG TPA: 30S ribosomal protein S12 methylthiotransferase RimO [Methylomirabilota bacterium]|nr:30S ribosomal protein S12 methylthiotransferase RimO [Methylomirabilota bacterium]